MGLNLVENVLPLAMDQKGRIRVGGTRVSLELVIESYLAGQSPESIVADYPVLQLADVYYSIGYYLTHRADVDAYLSTRAAEANAVRREVESRQPAIGVRDRLIARRAATPDAD